MCIRDRLSVLPAGLLGWFPALIILGKDVYKRQVITVQPNVADIAALDLASGENGPESLAHNTDDMSSPSSVRAYVEGDSLKKVHWKLTMRKRELIVRQYEEAARPDTLIIMDCGTISATREMALDRCV